MDGRFKSFAEIIKTDEGLNNLRQVMKVEELRDAFYNVFPELKEIVKIDRITNKVLYLKVESSVIRSELHLKQAVFVNKINNYLKEERIKSIKFYA